MNSIFRTIRIKGIATTQFKNKWMMSTTTATTLKPKYEYIIAEVFPLLVLNN